jgi:hypothetical protein
VFGTKLHRPRERSSTNNSNGNIYNREEEIKLMARICLQNMVALSGHGTRSHHKSTLLVTSQMWGTGKTWLGNHFLGELKKIKFQNFIEELRKEFGSENVDKLLSAVYIYIDLRDIPTKNIESLSFDLKILLLEELLLAHPEEDINHWSQKDDNETGYIDIFNHFSNRYKKYYFVHLDEVDKIMDIQPRVSNVRIEAATRYSKFWDDINQIMSSNASLYCSGRSTLLYMLCQLGKGKFQNIRNSLAAATCMLLTPLKEEHISQILIDTYGFNGRRNIIKLETNFLLL